MDTCRSRWIEFSIYCCCLFNTHEINAYCKHILLDVDEIAARLFTSFHRFSTHITSEQISRLLAVSFTIREIPEPEKSKLIKMMNVVGSLAGPHERLFYLFFNFKLQLIWLKMQNVDADKKCANAINMHGFLLIAILFFCLCYLYSVSFPRWDQSVRPRTRCGTCSCSTYRWRVFSDEPPLSVAPHSAGRFRIFLPYTWAKMSANESRGKAHWIQIAVESYLIKIPRLSTQMRSVWDELELSVDVQTFRVREKIPEKENPRKTTFAATRLVLNKK